MKFLRTPKILDRRDISKATYYNEIEVGLMPQPIKAGGRQAGIFEHELDRILGAYMRGETTDKIKEIVKDIEESRKTYGLHKERT